MNNKYATSEQLTKENIEHFEEIIGIEKILGNSLDADQVEMVNIEKKDFLKNDSIGLVDEEVSLDEAGAMFAQYAVEFKQLISDKKLEVERDNMNDAEREQAGNFGAGDLNMEWGR